VWSIEHVTQCSAPAPAVWDVWADVAGWPRWNPTVAAASLEGPFADGARGRFKHANGMPSKIVLRDVRQGVGFVVASGLPGARLHIEHEVTDLSEGGSRVTERAFIDGPLSRLWSFVLGRGLKRDIADGAEATAREAAG
jgi:hypothetical protein